MKEEILNEYSDINDSTILLYKNEEKFGLRLITNNSSHYCTNGCRKKCICKDKDWYHNYWSGYLASNNDYTIMYNIYQFICKYMDKISKLDRPSLYNWFKINNITFLFEFYLDKYNELILFYEKNKYILNNDFYHLVKLNYCNFYNLSLDEDINNRISFLSNKYNFLVETDDLIIFIELFQNYKHFDINSILEDEPKELFSFINHINYIYECISDNLESTI